MKTVVYSFLLLFFLQFHVNAQTSPTVNVDFEKNLITINQTTFTKTSTIADYEKVLGKAERIEKVGGKDKTFAYDKLGIAISVKSNTDIVQDISITYIYDGDKRVAKETYTGKLSINSKEIKQETTSDELSKISKLSLAPSMKGLYMAKGKALTFIVYYPESKIGQIGFGFQN